MICYQEEKVKEVVQHLTKKRVSLQPVGNHYLDRHLVYHISCENGISAIFKLYFKKNRWNREVASLKLLAESDVLCPKLLGYGILDDQTEWILMDYFKGKPYEQVQHLINEENKLDIYSELGRELGKIHSYKSFDFFGNWDENGKSINHITKFSDFFIPHVNTIYNEIYKQTLPDQDLLLRGIEYLKNHYHLLEQVKSSVLCHNDYGDRNALVRWERGQWRLSAVIDFEQSLPADQDKDLTYFLDILESRNTAYANAFKTGYEAVLPIQSSYDMKREFYLVYTGLYICSWAFKNAPEHYAEGIALLKRFV